MPTRRPVLRGERPDGRATGVVARGLGAVGDATGPPKLKGSPAGNPDGNPPAGRTVRAACNGSPNRNGSADAKGSLGVNGSPRAKGSWGRTVVASRSGSVTRNGSANGTRACGASGSDAQIGVDATGSPSRLGSPTASPHRGHTRASPGNASAQRTHVITPVKGIGQVTRQPPK